MYQTEQMMPPQPQAQPVFQYQEPQHQQQMFPRQPPPPVHQAPPPAPPKQKKEKHSPQPQQQIQQQPPPQVNSQPVSVDFGGRLRPSMEWVSKDPPGGFDIISRGNLPGINFVSEVSMDQSYQY